MNPEPSAVHDLFICHASEDKASVVARLAQKLSGMGLDVWYDDFSLRLGDSLRQAIDRGIAGSRHGLVVFSPAFFEKRWPQAELDGLFARGIPILPIWHNVTADVMAREAPTVALRYAARTDEGEDAVLAKILKVVKPEALVRVLNGRAVQVTPEVAPLVTGDWSPRTPVDVVNLSDQPVYQVSVALTLEAGNSRMIGLELTPRHRLTGRIGQLAVEPDIVLDGLDKDGKPTCLLLLHSLGPRERVSFVVSGRASGAQSAKIRIMGFLPQGPPVLEQPGRVAVPMTLPEAFTVSGQRLRFDRTS